METTERWIDENNKVYAYNEHYSAVSMKEVIAYGTPQMKFEGIMLSDRKTSITWYTVVTKNSHFIESKGKCMRLGS